MRTHRTLFAACSLTIGLVACGYDPTAPEAAACTDDTGTVVATITSGLTPTLEWDPACSIALLLVEEEASDMWGVSTDEGVWDDAAQANRITPPVTYGVAPAGITAFQDPLPLQAGVTYELVLWRVLPPSSTAPCVQRFENLCLLAVQTFVP